MVMARIMFCIVLGFGCLKSVWADDETKNSGALVIETKTNQFSADIYLGNKTDKEADRKRNKIGIGETITLSLTGKPKGDIGKLQWEITKGGQYAELEKRHNGKTRVKLRAKKRIKPDMNDSGDIQKNEFNVTVTAKTSEGFEVPIDLTIAIPSKIKAEHLNGGTPARSISPRCVGASAVLTLTVHPTDVSFKNAKVIERDLGSDPPEHPLDTETGHTGNGANKAVYCSNTNQIGDRIWRVIKQEQLNKIEKWPTEWAWKCSWRHHDGNGGPIQKTEKDDIFQIQYVEQKFRCHMVQKSIAGQIKSYQAMTISKFECSATRDQQDFKHQFEPKK